MKRAITIAAVAILLASTIWSGAQMFAQLFGGETWTPAELNPVAWYKFEDNILDSSGENNGTANGSSLFQSGKIGRAIYNTTTNRFVVADSAVFNAQTFSVAAWVFPSSTTGDRTIATKGSAAGFLFRSRNGGMIDFAWNSGFNKLSVPGLLPLGAWTHLLVAVNGNTATLYVNGAATATGTSGNNPISSSKDAMIVGARMVFDTPEYWLGAIDDFMFFGRTITAPEAKKLYDESVLKNGAAW